MSDSATSRRDPLRLEPYSPVTVRARKDNGRFTMSLDERVQLAMRRFPKRLPAERKAEAPKHTG
jgi:hypothetical protein